jgi:16S rRNA (guanine527-N7)-methyltransferase
MTPKLSQAKRQAKSFAAVYREIGVPGGLPVEAEARFKAWYELLLKWNRTTNLTRVDDPADAVAVHLLDAVPLARLLPPGSSLLDIGSGAGSPGLIVATLRPDVTVTCAESVNKKSAFLMQAAHALGLSNARVAAMRAEKLTEQFGFVCAKAVADPVTLIGQFNALLAPGGTWIFFVTTRQETVLPPGYGITDTIDYRLPGDHGERRLLAARKNE